MTCARENAGSQATPDSLANSKIVSTLVLGLQGHFCSKPFTRLPHERDQGLMRLDIPLSPVSGLRGRAKLESQFGPQSVISGN